MPHLIEEVAEQRARLVELTLEISRLRRRDMVMTAVMQALGGALGVVAEAATGAEVPLALVLDTMRAALTEGFCVLNVDQGDPLCDLGLKLS